MISVKLGVLVQSKDALETFSKEKLSAVQRKMVYKLYDKASDEISSFEKIRAEKAQEYGKKDDSGKIEIDDKGMVSFTPENFNLFIQEINALADSDVVFEFCDKLNLDSFPEVKLALQEEKALKWLFND